MIAMKRFLLVILVRLLESDLVVRNHMICGEMISPEIIHLNHLVHLTFMIHYYVMNSDYRVYVCLYNNATPENAISSPLLMFNLRDLDRRQVIIDDGYIGSICILSNQVTIKFDSTSCPVPNAWETSTDDAPVRQNAATSGH